MKSTLLGMFEYVEEDDWYLSHPVKIPACYDLMVNARPPGSYTPIPQGADLRDHIKIGDEIWISMNIPNSPTVLFSLEAGCSWDPEQGLNIEIKNGLEIISVEPH